MPLDTTGTYLQGYIDITYDNIVKALGESIAHVDANKQQVMWIVDTPAGVATVYDWGRHGAPKEKVTRWNVGGHTSDVVRHVSNRLNAQNWCVR